MTAKYANKIGWSDATPFEVVRAVGSSGKTLEIRRMAYKLNESWKPEIVIGGFLGHCVNQRSQKWDITTDESYAVERIRFSARDNVWRDKYGDRFTLSDKPVRFYDYNF